MSKDKVDGRGKSKGSMGSRFKKGRPSPNAKGRPKGSTNRHATILKVLNDVVSANLGGKKRNITVTEGALRRLAQEALNGKPAAISRVLELWKETEDAMQKSSEAKYPFNEADRQMIEDMYSRMQACKEPETDV